MTISEQLGFSILSAPVAAIDRRGLSQAWYSALYGATSKHAFSPQASRIGFNGGASESRRCARPFTSPVRHRSGASHFIHGSGSAPRIEEERRAPRIDLARKISELAARRTSKRASATFLLDGTRARVRVLVTAEGGRVRLIAVCAKKLQTTVAAALAQARYAAAAGGMSVMTIAQSGKDAPC